MRFPNALRLLSLMLALIGAAPRPAGAQAPPPVRQAFSRELTITNNHASPVDLPPVAQAFSREFTIANNHAFPTEAPAVHQALSRELTITNSHVAPRDLPPVRQAFSRELSISTPPPDLAVVSIAATPPAGLPGRPLAVVWRVRNFGVAAAPGPWRDRVFLSTDDRAGGDTLLGEVAYAGAELAPGGSYERGLALQFPQAAGRYWVVVETGHGGSLGETNGLNNSAVDDAPLRVEQPLAPDLIVREVIPPAGELLAGSTTSVSFLVTNMSVNSTYVSSWVDSVFLTAAPALGDPLSQEPYLLGQFPNASVLLPGASYLQTVDVILPEKIAGAFHFAIYADSRRQGAWRLGDAYDQDEENEANNWRFSAPVAVSITTLQPDLAPRALSFPGVASSSRAFTVSWRDENLGTAPTDTGGWTDAVYLSADQAPSIGPGDLRLGERRRSGLPLLPGQGENATLPAVLPADLSGSFFVKVAVDTGGAISEHGLEGNNVAVSPAAVTVILSPAIDLRPAAVAAPAAGFPGHAIDVTWSIENIGAPPMDLAQSWQDALYLSADPTWEPGDDALLGRFAAATTRDAGGRLVLENYTRTVSVRLPNATPAGGRYIIVVADEGNQVFEGFDNPGPADDGLEEHNNVLASSPLEVSLLSTDLVVEPGLDAAHPVPASGAAGQSLALSWRVTNAGALATPVSSWRDAVYFSLDAHVDAGDAELVSAARGFLLPAGGAYGIERQAEVPPVAAGDYFLLFAADAGDRVLELAPGEENNVAATPFRVTGAAADLEVAGVEAPPAARAGEAVAISWTARNGGTRPTNRDLWSDRVYLSLDSLLDGGDVLLGSRTHGGFLEPGESYPAAAAFDLPPGASGPRHVIVETDAGGNVFETNEANNAAAREMLIDIEALRAPNLVVTSVTIDGQAVSGQTLHVVWMVRNDGTGPTTAAAWRDSVFLSRDRVLDPQFDLFLGGADHEGILAPTASYTASGAFDVPAGVSGSYYVFVAVDRGASNFEEGLILDNQAAGDDPLPVALPSPSDLAVLEALPPAAGVLGESAHWRWRVGNLGGAPVVGRWFDALFLSADDHFDLEDAFLGRFESRAAGPLAAGGSVLLEADALVAAPAPGLYHLIVRADVLDQVPEDVDGNNLGVSAGTVQVSAVPLLLDGPPAAARLAAGEERFFELETPAARTVRLSLDHASPTAWTELYARRGAAPTPGVFDVRSAGVGVPDQTLVIPETTAGKYYVLARATRGTFAPAGESMTLTARTIPFSIEAVSPRAIGNAGRVTLAVAGSRFEAGGGAFLERPGAARRAARRVEFLDAARLRATFVADGLALGPHDLIVSRRDGSEARLAAAVVVERAAPPLLEVVEPSPSALREGASAGNLELGAVNRGNVDAEYVFLLGVFEEREGRELLRFGSSSPFAGPAARAGFLGAGSIVRSLAPGERATLSLTARAGQGSGGEIALGLGAALFTTTGFLAFQEAAAEAARLAVLGDPGLVRAEGRDLVIGFAREAASWRDYWLGRLAAAGLVDAIDIEEGGGPGRSPGGTRCLARAAEGREPPDFAPELDEILCSEWLARLVGAGAEATQAFALDPTPGAAARLGSCGGPLAGCAFPSFWAVRRSNDPNEKTGSEGAGEEAFVPQGRSISYRVHFENMPSATGPAAIVRITDPLDPALNAGSFRVGDIAFGGQVIDVPEGLVFYQGRVEVATDPGLELEVVAGVDTGAGSGFNEAFWILSAIDKETGLPPVDGGRGFLPPSDGTGSGAGAGWVEYTVAPDPTIAAKIVIRNEACITFDANEPMETPAIRHTLDPTAPASQVEPLPETVETPRIPLRWSGEDEPEGSGLAGFTLHVAIDGGPFAPFLESEGGTEGEFLGEPGRRYAFYSRARDQAGNEEAAPAAPDAVTTVRGGVSRFRRGDTNADGTGNITDAVYLLNFLYLGGPPPPCADASDTNDDGVRNITDAVYLLNFLYLGGPPPPAPGIAACGFDTTGARLGPCDDPRGICR